MISFDLLNERKIEVRHRIYWFLQHEPSMILPGQKFKTFVTGRRLTTDGLAEYCTTLNLEDILLDMRMLLLY